MLSIKSILNPTGNIAQLFVILCFVFFGAIGWEFVSKKYLDEPCPETTSINNEIKAGKKNPNLNLNLNNEITEDCFSIEELEAAGIPKRHLNKLKGE